MLLYIMFNRTERCTATNLYYSPQKAPKGVISSVKIKQILKLNEVNKALLKQY